MSIIVNHLFNGDETFDVYIDSNTNRIKVVFIVNGNENICEYGYDEFKPSFMLGFFTYIFFTSTGNL